MGVDMLHVYERKPKEIRKRTKIPTNVVQTAAPSFLWQPSGSYLLLRGAFFAALHETKKMRLDRDVDKLMAKKVDTSGLNIIRKEDLDGASIQDLS